MRICIALVFLLISSLQSYAQNYKYGRYYDLDGIRYDGYLNENHFSISFKEANNLNTERKKIDKVNILGYVIESDSCAAIENVKIPLAEFVERDFAKVLEIGKISLYSYQSTMQSTTGGIGGVPVGVYYTTKVETPILMKNGKAYRMSKKKDFEDILPLLVADCEQIATQLQARYTDEELRLLIQSYNEYFPDYVPVKILPSYELVIYRKPNKKFKEPISLQLDNGIPMEMVDGSYKEIGLKSNTVTIECIELDEKIVLELEPKVINYIECAFDKKTGEFSFYIAKKDEGEFDSYIALKAQKKREK